MNNAKLIERVVAGGVAGCMLAVGVALLTAAGPSGIKGGRLDSDLDAGGHGITNLASGGTNGSNAATVGDVTNLVAAAGTNYAPASGSTNYAPATGSTNYAPAAHVAATNNPHGVTKDQVGLGAVENTALSLWAGSPNLSITANQISNSTDTGRAVLTGNQTQALDALGIRDPETGMILSSYSLTSGQAAYAIDAGDAESAAVLTGNISASQIANATASGISVLTGNASAGRTALELGTAATSNASNFVSAAGNQTVTANLTLSGNNTVQLAYGSGGAPTMRGPVSNTGFYPGSTGGWVYTDTGAARWRLIGDVIEFSSAVGLFWAQSGITTTRDLGLSRISAGVLGLGNGTASDRSGTLRLGSIEASGNLTVNGTGSILGSYVMGDSLLDTGTLNGQVTATGNLTVQGALTANASGARGLVSQVDNAVQAYYDDTGWHFADTFGLRDAILGSAWAQIVNTSATAGHVPMTSANGTWTTVNATATYVAKAGGNTIAGPNTMNGNTTLSNLTVSGNAYMPMPRGVTSYGDVVQSLAAYAVCERGWYPLMSGCGAVILDGSGGGTPGINGWRLYTGATANSTAMWVVNNGGFSRFGRASSDVGIQWSRAVSIGWAGQVDLRSTGVMRLQVGRTYDAMTVGDLSTAGVGVIFSGGNITAEAHDGVTRRTGYAGTYSTVGPFYVSVRLYVKAGSLWVWINDTLITSAMSGAPSTDSAASACGVHLSLENGATAADYFADIPPAGVQVYVD